MVLSIEQHWEIIFLHLHRLGPKLSIRVIVKELQYSKDTVQTWINKYQKTGDIQDEEGRGRKRKTSERKDLDIISMAKKQRTSTLVDISISMSRQGTNISFMTVKRKLNEESLYKLKSLLKLLLSENYRESRLNWAKAIKNIDWLNIILQIRLFSHNLGNQRKSEDRKERLLKFQQ